MASLSWKKKLPKLKSCQTSAVFNKEEEPEKEYLDDWIKLLPASKKPMLEDSNSIAKRLMEEGVLLAEGERYVTNFIQYSENYKTKCFEIWHST